MQGWRAFLAFAGGTPPHFNPMMANTANDLKSISQLL